MAIKLTCDYSFVNSDSNKIEFQEGAVIDDPELEAFVRRDTQSWIEVISESERANKKAELQQLSRRELQNLAVARGVQAKGNKATLIKVLLDAERVP